MNLVNHLYVGWSDPDGRDRRHPKAWMPVGADPVGFKMWFT